MHLSLRGVLRYGSAALLVTAVILLVVLFRGIAVTREAVEKLASEGRESAAAFELGIGTLETAMAVVSYRDTGDPAQRVRVEQNRRNFATWLARYRKWADPTDLTHADRLGALHDEFDQLGMFLMAEHDARRNGSKVSPVSVTLAPPLPRFLQLSRTIDDLIDEMQTRARGDRELAERHVNAAHRSMQTVLILASTALLMVLGLLAISSVLFVSRPLDRLLAGTQAISGGRLSHRIRLEGQSELAIVGRAIDSMAESLQVTLVSRDKVTANSQRLTKINEELSAQIAQRRAAEEQLRLSEERYRSIFHRSPTAIFRMTRNGRLTDYNQSFARLLGEDGTEDLKGRAITEVLGESEQLSTLLGQLNEQGAVDSMEMRVARADGRSMFLLVSVAIARGDDDTRTVYEGTLIDITERKQSQAIQNTLQERLGRAAAEWSWTFDSISDLVIVLDEDGRISRVNEAARLLARRDHAQCVGLPVREVYGELGAHIGRLSRSAVRERKPQTTAVRDLESGASWSLLVNPRMSEGAAVGIVAVARDSSYMEELEATVRRSQRMAEMGSFVAGVAHEVRNPLFGITANLDAMDLALEPNSESLEFSHRIRAELGRLTELMRDLLDYARPSVTQMEPASIREIVEKSVAATQLYARDAGVTVESRIDPTLDKTRMNARRVRQALQNLIENAVIFSPRGSTVRIDVSPTADGRAPSVTFAVSDSGPGFRAEDIPHALEPFFTRRRGGTGLGLSIVRRVAEDHGGGVTIGTSAEGGAMVSFSVTLEDERDA